tara:strand:- start:654 stop:1139 length:486 start_codon:yes stop_codon:yes gene_type:complete
MYQKEITPELIAMSTGVALWSQARYGWFISSKISDKQIALELARELEQLSNHQLNFIEDAKRKWVDDQHDRPPNVVEFVGTVKQVCEIDRKKRETERLTPQLTQEKKDYAGLWDSASDEEKMTFFDRNNAQEIPSATKYWARKFYRGKGLEEEKITELLEY